MSASADRPFGKRQSAQGDDSPSMGSESRSWRKALSAMLLSGLAVLVHRALVPKPRNNTAGDGTGSDGSWSDGSSDGGDGGGD